MDEIARAISVSTVLSNAPRLGLNEAIKQFGQGLLDTDKAALSALTTEELTSLTAIRQKLGSIDPIAAHINNNNNGKEA